MSYRKRIGIWLGAFLIASDSVPARVRYRLDIKTGEEDEDGYLHGVLYVTRKQYHEIENPPKFGISINQIP